MRPRTTFAIVVLLCACKKTSSRTTTSLRPLESLPHVDRLFPTVVASMPLDARKRDGVLECMNEALTRDATAAGTVRVAERAMTITSGKLDSALFQCLVDWQAPADGTIVVGSEMRHEAVPPGVKAVAEVKRRDLVKWEAPLAVRGARARGSFTSTIQDGKRQLAASIEIDVEFTDAVPYEDCGSLRDFGPKEGLEAPCPKVKGRKGQLRTFLEAEYFTLEGADGWKDSAGHHWFGDELREVEQAL